MKTGLFVKKSINWIKNYADFKNRQLQQFLRKHIDWYDTRLVREDARTRLGLDQFRYFRDICGVREFCIREKIPCRILREGEEASVVSPEYFEGSRREILRFGCPAIYMAELAGTSVYGYSELITIGETALSDAYMYDKGQKRYNIGGGSLAKYKIGKYIFATYKESGLAVPRAISMLGWRPDNYYHFTLEIISRLAYADRFEEYRDWPVLIDACVLEVEQLKDLLQSMNLYGHPMIAVEARTRVEVEKLLFISYNMWMPHNFRENAAQYPSDYLFSPSLAENIRKCVLKKYAGREEDYGKRVFLSRRKCDNQRLVNAQEIEVLFKEAGFSIVYPEELSFEEEVRVFQNADVIAGPTGAALTNVVYCRENTLIAIIAPDSHKSYFFSNVAYLVGARFMLLGADMVSKGIAESMDVFRLDEKKCSRFLESLDAWE